MPSFEFAEVTVNKNCVGSPLAGVRESAGRAREQVKAPASPPEVVSRDLRLRRTGLSSVAKCLFQSRAAKLLTCSGTAYSELYFSSPQGTRDPAALIPC